MVFVTFNMQVQLIDNLFLGLKFKKLHLVR